MVEAVEAVEAAVEALEATRMRARGAVSGARGEDAMDDAVAHHHHARLGLLDGRAHTCPGHGGAT